MFEVFDSLIDQEQVVALLKEAVVASRDSNDESQSMTHAWLFTGPPGSGRSNAALAFGAALICPEAGCGTCVNCRTAIAGTHADIELLRTEGLSIKIDEIRELIIRAAWSPSVATYRVVIIEDADRLTESAANALLKGIEEPGMRTVWLLCAPTLTDVLPTIRSRTRNLVLRTPSVNAVAQLLEMEGVLPKPALFAARVSQGHVGRARQLASNSQTRELRLSILRFPLAISDIASAFRAAQLLVEAAKKEAEGESERRDAIETGQLKEAWGQQGSKLTQGGSQAIKELEKEQKSRSTRMVRDYLDRALLDLATLYRDVLLAQTEGISLEEVAINLDLLSEIEQLARRTTAESTLQRIDAIMQARVNLSKNSNSLLTIEALMVALK